jgi:lysophospholipase L1-like esterase
MWLILAAVPRIAWKSSLDVDSAVDGCHAIIMPKTLKIGFVLLVALLVVSVGLNLVLYQQGRDYYLQLTSVRLDPLGLNAYPTTQSLIANSARPIIVFFGDSRAADWTAPAGITGTVLNRGIGNETSMQALGRFAGHVSPLKPDVIVIQIGINDLKTIPLFPEQKESIIANLKANVRHIVELSVRDGARVILTTIFPVGRVPLERRMFWSDDVAPAIKEVNQYLTSLASATVTVFDTARILANDEGIVNSGYSRDFLHLNAEGYEALNQELSRVINQ